jgi:hypothetical protein
LVIAKQDEISKVSHLKDYFKEFALDAMLLILFTVIVAFF